MARELVIAIVGAVVLATAGVALFVLEDRAGPYTADLSPASASLASSGRYVAEPARGSTLPGGVCQDGVPGGECTPASTSLSWTLFGLPEIPGVAYVGRLADPVVDLGPFVKEGDQWTLRYEAEEHHAATALQLVMTSSGASDIVLVEVPVQATGQTGLDLSLDIDLGGDGEARFEQIGAVGVSLLVDLDLPPAPAGWAYEARLGLASLGTLDQVGDRAVLDTRIERLRIADGDAVVVFLVPAGESDGLPVFQGRVREA